MSDNHLPPEALTLPYAIEVEGVGHGPAAMAATAEEAIRIAQRLSTDPMFADAPVRIYDKDGVCAVVIDGALNWSNKNEDRS